MILLIALSAACGVPGVPPLTVVPPSVSSGEQASVPGLVSAVPATNSALVVWSLPANAALEVAVFQATDPQQVYAGAPVLVAPTGDSALLGGLTEDVEYWFGLGVRPLPAPPAMGGAFEPAGELLVVRTGAPIYLDPGADASIADGKTPGTAFAGFVPAMLTAFLQGGGNVWALGADYGNSTALVFVGADLYGGFGPTFDLAQRDPALYPTLLRGVAGQTVVEVQTGALETVVIDGISIDGGGLATIGVDNEQSPLQLRSVEVRNCASRGIRLRASESDTALPVSLVSVLLESNAGGGLSGIGSLALSAVNSSFLLNAQEGLDLDDLVARAGGTASLFVEGCTFVGNLTEGLDVDLAAPSFGGLQGGAFEIRIQKSLFEANGTSGLLIDIDYELFPLWSAEIEVLGCTARANLTHGFQLDLDSTAAVLLHGNLAVSNGGDGFHVTSESSPGFAQLSTSVAAGNLGAGARASLGNYPLLVGHCVFAGNQGGGVVSEFTESSAASCVAYLQPNPWSGVRTSSCPSVGDPLAGAFALLPEQYLTAVGFDGVELTPSSLQGIQPGFVIELSDDAVARTVVSVSPTAVVLNPNPDTLATPSAIALFAPGSGVVEDYSLPAASALLGAGLTPPGGAPVDAGPWGAPVPVAAGVAADVADRFWFGSSLPAPSDGLLANQSVALSFTGGALDPGSLTQDAVVARDGTGALLAVSFQLIGGALVVDPPVGGWSQGALSLELHSSLSSVAGTQLATAIVLPLTVP